MMASSSALDFQCGSRIEPKPQGSFVSPPEKLTTPRPGRAVREGACCKTAAR